MTDCFKMLKSFRHFSLKEQIQCLLHLKKVQWFKKSFRLSITLSVCWNKNLHLPDTTVLPTYSESTREVGHKTYASWSIPDGLQCYVMHVVFYTMIWLFIGVAHCGYEGRRRYQCTILYICYWKRAESPFMSTKSEWGEHTHIDFRKRTK